MAGATPKKLNPLILGPAALVLFTAWLFSPSLDFDFTLDDTLIIERNPQVSSPDIDYARILDSSLYADTPLSEGNNNLYRPTLALSLALDLQAADRRLDPVPFHRTNLLLFLTCVLCIYWVATLLFGAADPSGTSRNQWLALSVAFVFAVLPSHLEVAANIKHREEILALLFALTAWGLSLRPMIGYARWRLLLIFLCYLIALGSKESAVLLLPCFLLFEWGLGRTRSGRIPAYLMMGLALTAYLGLRISALGSLVAPSGTRTFFDPSVTVIDRVAMSASVFLDRYVWDQLFALGLNPAFSSPFVLRHVGRAGPGDYMALGVVVLGSLASLYAIRSHRSMLAYGWLFFVLGSALTFQVLPIGTGGAYRLVFAGTFGLSLCLVLCIDALTRRLPASKVRPTAFTLLAFILCVRFAAATHERIRIFESDESIFTYSMEVEPDDPLSAHAVASVTDGPTRAGERAELFEEALRRFESSRLPLDQFDERSLNAYAVVVTEVGFSRVVSNPESAIVLADRGIDLFDRLETMRGGLFEPNIAGPYYVKALAQRHLGRTDAAITTCELALALTPHRGLEILLAELSGR